MFVALTGNNCLNCNKHILESTEIIWRTNVGNYQFCSSKCKLCAIGILGYVYEFVSLNYKKIKGFFYVKSKRSSNS